IINRNNNRLSLPVAPGLPRWWRNTVASSPTARRPNLAHKKKKLRMKTTMIMPQMMTKSSKTPVWQGAVWSKVISMHAWLKNAAQTVRQSSNQLCNREAPTCTTVRSKPYSMNWVYSRASAPNLPNASHFIFWKPQKTTCSPWPMRSPTLKRKYGYVKSALTSPNAVFVPFAATKTEIPGYYASSKNPKTSSPLKEPELITAATTCWVGLLTPSAALDPNSYGCASCSPGCRMKPSPKSFWPPTRILKVRPLQPISLG